MTAAATRRARRLPSPVRVDDWLFAPGSARAVAAVRAGLAAVTALRVGLGPYRDLAGTPDALFLPPTVLSWLPGMPPAGVIVAVQVLGTAAAVLVLLGRRPALTFPVAWASLLLLAGLRDSLGKVLHNDVLLLVAAVPFLLAPADARFGDRQVDRRFGWPVRTSMVLVAGAYFVTGVQKLVHSGLDWVTGDNFRWVMYAAAGDGRGATDAVALFIADHAGVAHVAAAGLLGFELCFPLAVLVRRLWPLAVGGALVLHAATWFTLGLDYWAWALTVAVVFWDWDRRRGFTAPRR